MRLSLSAIWLLLFAIVRLMGCGPADKTAEVDNSSSQSHVAAARADTSKDQRQYRAVCLEKEAHGGNEYVLSRWLDDKDKAFALGQYHGDFKDKGHRWRLEERVKPKRVNL